MLARTHIHMRGADGTNLEWKKLFFSVAIIIIWLVLLDYAAPNVSLSHEVRCGFSEFAAALG